jgi:hypothetical protein
MLRTGIITTYLKMRRVPALCSGITAYLLRRINIARFDDVPKLSGHSRDQPSGENTRIGGFGTENNTELNTDCSRQGGF